MKKLFMAITLILSILFISGALAEPTETYVAIDSVGEMVVRVQIRLRELSYLYFKPTGSFKRMTESATREFQKNQTDVSGGWIGADGTIGLQTANVLFSVRAKRAPIPVNVKIPIGKPLLGKPTIIGKLTPWNEVKTLLILKKSYKITDYNTGVSFNMSFVGGENHAEMECDTAADAAIFLNIFGGVYNYSKRPMIISVDGKDVAASMQGFPHGTDSNETNDVDGHACLFFEGSFSHVGNLPDIEHQKLVYVAAGN
ncbi:MAG: hypothetical protein RRY79_06710 [Clostridia bacterium]